MLRAERFVIGLDWSKAVAEPLHYKSYCCNDSLADSG
jgi:hypothetical protein